MKTIRIIADRPAKGQDSIAGIIGDTFPVKAINKGEDNKPDGTVTIDAGDGSIVIQKDEYEVVN